MMTWEITGGGLPAIRIKARSFDEALKKARLRNENYCCGWIVDDDCIEDE